MIRELLYRMTFLRFSLKEMKSTKCAKHSRSHRIIIVLCFVASLAFVLVIQGAIPFLTAPTLGQAIWTAGFGQSFTNESLFNIYAHHFGAPAPAAISFGLAGAWPTGLFIKLGLSPIDAYSSMTALWLTVAFCSAFAVARHFLLSRKLAVLAAVAWGTMPAIWANSGYSMISLGVALLPFYHLSSLKLFHFTGKESLPNGFALVRIAIFALFACIVSAFMDGYSFVMFAVAGSILGEVSFIQNSTLRNFYLKFAIPVHLIGFATAYLLYTHYIGTTEFDVDPLDSIRSGGVDLTFLAIPTKGISWIMDSLGASISRSDHVFFGDAAVWNTTYCLPVLLAAVWVLSKTKKSFKQTFPFLLCLLFAFYMALGPSLKINSKKTLGQEMMGTMPASYAICATGSGLISQNLPGFKNMRCCYRWTALTVFCAWTLIIQSAYFKTRKHEWIPGAILGLVAITNLPNIPLKLKEYIHYRESFFELEHDWIDDMREVLNKGERVAFLPWRNDFLVTYLAPRLEIISYNTGGDKNLAEARKHWPRRMSEFTPETIDTHFAERVLRVLEEREADRIILPYVDFRLAAHQWPYPIEFKEDIQAILDELKNYGTLDIIERDYYTSVELIKKRKAR